MTAPAEVLGAAEVFGRVGAITSDQRGGYAGYGERATSWTIVDETGLSRAGQPGRSIVVAQFTAAGRGVHVEPGDSVDRKFVDCLVEGERRGVLFGQLLQLGEPLLALPQFGHGKQVRPVLFQRIHGAAQGGQCRVGAAFQVAPFGREVVGQSVVADWLVSELAAKLP
jgi:hypothetical protein